MLKQLLVFTMLMLGLASCQQAKTPINLANEYHTVNTLLTDIIVEDIFSPPVASRIYSNSNVAAMLAAYPQQSKSYTKNFKGFNLQSEEQGNEIASLYAFLMVAKKMVYSKHLIDEKVAFYDSLLVNHFDANLVKEAKINAAKLVVEYGKWLLEDGYRESRFSNNYLVDTTYAGSWRPTAPNFIEAIEPNWRNIRPFVIDSAGQFQPELPTKFSNDPSSEFYKETKEVYDVVKNLTEEQKDIARFWDCNPIAATHRGHFMFVEKKLTPGGHWMSITTQVLKSKNANLQQCVAAYATVGLTMADAFISCWDEKYRSNLIRPETYIHKYIDNEWEPILQTPAFPEYTSGHSVVSASCASVLTHMFGDSFFFVDSTEVKYGLPIRTFNSFNQAASEAAISRLYGGIHYRPAIDNGVVQGRAIGQFIIDKTSLNPFTFTEE